MDQVVLSIWQSFHSGHGKGASFILHLFRGSPSVGLRTEDLSLTVGSLWCVAAGHQDFVVDDCRA